MDRRSKRLCGAFALALLFFGLTGCNPMTASREGIDVMFDGNPRITQQDVFYRGRMIGKVLNQQAGNGMVYKVTIQLLPEYGKAAGKNWVFYADNGLLKASTVSVSGPPLAAGDKVCGFGSKTSLNWFKLRTVLSDRVYKVTQKAETLSRRFG